MSLETIGQSPLLKYFDLQSIQLVIKTENV